MIVQRLARPIPAWGCSGGGGRFRGFDGEAATARSSWRSSEIVATELYGIRRRVRSIGLSADELFVRCLERRLGERAG